MAAFQFQIWHEYYAKGMFTQFAVCVPDGCDEADVLANYAEVYGEAIGAKVEVGLPCATIESQGEPPLEDMGPLYAFL